jgi:hypothetical protein
MPQVVGTIDVSRRPKDIFSYVTDFSLFPRMAGRDRVGAPRR